MANWNGLQMTTKGIALQAKVEAGEPLVITKIKLGSGVLPEHTNIKDLTDLVEPKQNLGVTSKETMAEYCKVKAVLSNSGLPRATMSASWAYLPKTRKRGTSCICILPTVHLTTCPRVVAVQQSARSFASTSLSATQITSA